MTTAPKIDARRLAEVNPAGWYSVTQVADLFGRDARTVQRWCRLGRLPHTADPGDGRRLLVLGRAILAFAGGLVLDRVPSETESERQREARGRAELDAINGLLKGRAVAAGI